MKKILIWTAAMMLALSCMTFAGADQYGKNNSWTQINQSLLPGEEWRQIVTDRSAFALGEDTPYPEDENIRIRSWGTWPSMDGSTVCVPMAVEAARQWLGLSEEDLNGFINFSRSPNAIERLIRKTPNPMVTIASENVVMDDTAPVNLYLGTMPNADALALAETEGVSLRIIPFCYDAFVFIVNGANPTEGLTVQQIRDIYTVEDEDAWPPKAKLSEWKEITPGFDESIRAFERPHGSGSQTAMEEMVMQGAPIFPADEADIVGGMSDLVKRVGNYDNSEGAIGYSYLYYVDELYKSGDVKVLAVDGIAPTPENLRSGAYPFTVSYYAICREDDENAIRFAEWLTGKEGQACAAQAGYIPVTEP